MNLMVTRRVVFSSTTDQHLGEAHRRLEARVRSSSPASHHRQIAQLPSSAGVGSRRCSAIPEYAELVALGIGQHHPRDFALPDVDT